MKRVLAIVPYEQLYPPRNGGLLRCFHLLHQLALRTELTVIMLQDRSTFLEAVNEYPAIARMKVYSIKDAGEKKDLFSLLPKKLRIALRYRWQKKTLKGPADINFLLFYPVIRHLLKSNKYDAILLENISTLNLVSMIRGLDKEVRIIYDAHNVDSNLAREDLRNNVITQRVYEAIHKVESNLSGRIDGLIACSEQDLNIFQELNNNHLVGAVIPNGVWIDEADGGESINYDQRAGILFCGSLDYAPNIEGLLWFYHEVWPGLQGRMPGVQLTVIGGGRPDERLTLLQSAPSIRFIGKVSDVKEYYRTARIAIVPLLSGSGTRLKIMEAMSLQVPVVSTSKGAEGIEYRDGEHILIADEPKRFADAVIRLLNDEVYSQEIGTKAFQFVKARYDWNIIGKKLSQFFYKGNE